MTRLTQTPNGLKIAYTHGDAFKIIVSGDEETLKNTLRFQVSPNGDSNDLLIDKIFYPGENNAFEITLTKSELNGLLNKNTYHYRISFLSDSGSIVTTVSGILEIKWGA